MLTNDSNDLNKPISEERLIFARNFRRARKSAGLTQQAITDRTGFAQSWLSEVERGLSPPSIDSMAELAKVVGQPLWKLLQP
jgi:transcriptional regulator with XRE-family HTH domain